MAICVQYRERLEIAAGELCKLGEVVTLPADVRDFGSAKLLLNDALEHFGRIDVLVNNAGGIVSMASGRGKAGLGGVATYCASKFAVVGFTESSPGESRDWGTGLCGLPRQSRHRHAGAVFRECLEVREFT